MTKITPPLPEWLEKLLPEDRPVQTLHVSDDEITIKYPDGAYETCESLRQADSRLNVNDYDTSVIDDRSGPDDFLGRGTVSFPVENNYVGIIFSHTDADRRSILEDAYEYAYSAFKRYYADPNNFVKAWQMLDTHPAFWTLVTDHESNPWSWNTEGYCSKIRQRVGIYDGEVYVSLEAGGHVPSLQNPDTGEDELNYKTHYGDWRLEVVGESFEDAVIKLANRVSICFKPDGTDRPEAEHVLENYKPDWIYDLEERLANLD